MKYVIGESTKISNIETNRESSSFNYHGVQGGMPGGIPIMTSAMPLGKSNVYNFSDIYVKPINFIGFLSYIRNYPKNSDDFTKFLYTLHFVSHYVTRLYDLYLPDIYYALFMFWGISINENMSFDLNYECSSCGSINKANISMSDVKFRTFDSPVFDVLITNSQHAGKYMCKFPTGRKISDHIHRLTRHDNFLTSLDTAFLILSFVEYERRPNEIKEMVVNAVYDDIVTLASVIGEYIQPPVEPHVHVCRNCGHKNILNYYGDLSRDFFRVFVENRRLIEY